MYRAYITKVKNIRPAENADRLNLADVFGTTTVVDKTVNINDLYIYFPVEGQISQEFGEPNGAINEGSLIEESRPKNDIYVYRMTMTNEDGDVVEYTPDYMRYRCEQMGVKTVPVLEQFYLRYGDPAEPKNKVMQAKLKSIVESWYEGPDLIDPRHIREGVVVRIINRPKFTAYKAKGFDFKVISGIIKETANIENMSEDELGEL